MIGYIILGVTCALLFAFLTALLVTKVRGRKIWKFPEGKRTTVTYRGYTAHLIVLGVENAVAGISNQEVAKRCAVATYCTALTAKNRNLEDVPNEVTVHVVEDLQYTKLYDDRWKAWNIKSNGMLLTVDRKAGDEDMPLIACRQSAFGGTAVNGSLVVHELTHLVIEENETRSHLDNGDHNHEDKNYWAAPGTFEYEAQALTAEMIKNDN
jgi:hypothetical protein